MANEGLAEYCARNLEITTNVLDVVGRTAPRGVLLASSGAVYGRDGHPRLMLADNPYGALKRLDELAFAAACAGVGARLCVARVFNVSGPYMREPERYALGSFIAATLAGNGVTVRARHPVIRSYTPAAEVAALGLAVLADHGSPPVVTFDTHGGHEIEIGDLALEVTAALGHPELEVHREGPPTGPADRYVGAPVPAAAMRKQYGIAPAPLADQIRATAAAIETAG